MNKSVSLFLQLVKISSPSGNEDEMIKFVRKWLDKNKLSYKIDALGNILAKNNAKGEPQLFCVHMDTVQPGENIQPVIKSDCISSSGNTILGADNKAALSCLLRAVEKHLTTENQKAFELLFTVKEETGGGVEYFPFSWIKSKSAYIFDWAKPLGGIVLRSPYIINFSAEIIGKTAHSSTPEKGNNALIVTTNILNKINCGKLDKGETTINIGLINGGTGINIIPGKITLTGEIRSYQKKLFEKHLKTIEKLFKQSQKTGIKISFKTNGYCPGYSHNKNLMQIKKLKKIFSEVHLKTKYRYFSGVSDANILNSIGIKTINVCDGVKNPHTTKEKITITSLNLLQNIILNLITD